MKSLNSKSGLIHLSDEIGKNYLCGMGSGEAVEGQATCKRCKVIYERKNKKQ